MLSSYIILHQTRFVFGWVFIHQQHLLKNAKKGQLSLPMPKIKKDTVTELLQIGSCHCFSINILLHEKLNIFLEIWYFGQ